MGRSEATHHYEMTREQLRRARYCFYVAFERRLAGDAGGVAIAYDAAVFWLQAADKDRRTARRLRSSPDCESTATVASLA